MASSSFGPFSHQIDIHKFVHEQGPELNNSLDDPAALLPTWAQYNALPEAAKKAIERECDLSVLVSKSLDPLESPEIHGHLIAERARALESHFTEKEYDYKRKKRKRFGELVSADDTALHQDVAAFAAASSNVTLSAWSLSPESRHFIRKARAYEYNALTSIKSFQPMEGEEEKTLPDDPQEALITITMYDRAHAPPHYVHRSATVVLLSSQTLGDLYDALPCPSVEMPSEVRDEDGDLVTYDLNTRHMAGCVLCVSGTAYGDGLDEEDYADKLVEYLGTIKQPASRKHITINKGQPIHSVRLDSLKLSLHFPNWILHHGNCEHYFAIDQIRLLHSSDPKAGYPLILHVSPPSRALCRLCEKIPASFSLVHDIRLPESPYLVCSSCRDFLGPSRNAGSMVVPLVKFTMW